MGLYLADLRYSSWIVPAGTPKSHHEKLEEEAGRVGGQLGPVGSNAEVGENGEQGERQAIAGNEYLLVPNEQDSCALERAEGCKPNRSRRHRGPFRKDLRNLAGIATENCGKIRERARKRIRVVAITRAVVERRLKMIPRNR